MSCKHGYVLHIQNANTFAITAWWNIASCTNRQINVKQKGKYVFVFKMAAEFKSKRISITTARIQYPTIATFPTSLLFH
jgi:hypothetical protein